MIINLWIAGTPVAQGRPRFARIGAGVRTFDPKKSSDWKKVVADSAKLAGVKPFLADVPLTIAAIFHLPRPASVPAKKRPYPIVKPDIDNYFKAALDGLKGIAWHDDCQIVKATMEKIYSETPGIRITVKEVVSHGM